MNSPVPCCFCKHIYVNCMLKNNPEYKAECFKDNYVPCNDEEDKNYDLFKTPEYLNICKDFQYYKEVEEIKL